MSRSGPRPLQLDAWRAFLETHAVVTAVLDTELRAAHGLPLTHYDVLVQLSEAGGRLRMSELADAVLLTRSNCTRLVDRLVTDGLVTREPDPTDARARWAVMTEDGRRRLRAAAPTHLAGIERHFARFVDDDAAQAMLGAFSRASEATSSSGATRRRTP
ncbi:MAG: MarR family transcriptional regulator [Acidimicrobiales bacterium]